MCLRIVNITFLPASKKLRASRLLNFPVYYQDTPVYLAQESTLLETQQLTKTIAILTMKIFPMQCFVDC